MVRKVCMGAVAALCSLPVWGAVVSLEADRETVPVGETVTVTLTIVEESSETVREVRTPSFDGFEIEHQSESSSSSISIINGRISSRKERTVTYLLRSLKAGVYSIGPAVAIVARGSEVKSNVLRLTVIGGGATPILPPSPQAPLPDASGQAESRASGGADLFAPLSEWEKQTGRYFVRVIVSPEGFAYQGEPILVSYYLFTQKNLISDISFYRSPSFDNAWSEEIATPKRLSFNRTNIGGVVYDYALLRQYLLIPSPSAQRLTGTQMILDVVTGGFFDMRKRSLSSIALDIPLRPLPDADRYPGGIVGDFTITQNRTSLSLDANKPLDTIIYTVTGCGNLHHLELTVTANEGVKVFAPDVKQEAQVESGKLCGTKTFSFMAKGLREGEFSLAAPTITCWDREKGWQVVSGTPVTVTVGSVADDTAVTERKRIVRYEILRELPEDLVVYDLSPLTTRSWFRIALFSPLIVVGVTLLRIGLRSLVQRRRVQRTFRVRMWGGRLSAAADTSTLLNVYYDAVKDLSGIALRGVRKSEVEKRLPGKGCVLTEVADIIQASAYGGNSADLTVLKKRAIEALYLVAGGGET